MKPQEVTNLFALVILTMAVLLVLPAPQAAAFLPQLPDRDGDTDKGPKTEYVPDAVLSAEQQEIVLELAAKRGIKDVVEISTYVLHPSSYREIAVKGIEQITGREVSTQILIIHFKDWSPREQAPRKDDIQIGDFWAGKPYIRKQTILKVAMKDYRTGSISGVSIEECESILARLLEGKYTLGSAVRQDSLKEIDWSRPRSFHKRDDGVFVEFLHKAGEGDGFFELEIKPAGDGLTIQQVDQVVR
jgi:hypothetical protein